MNDFELCILLMILSFLASGLFCWLAPWPAQWLEAWLDTKARRVTYAKLNEHRRTPLFKIPEVK